MAVKRLTVVVVVALAVCVLVVSVAVVLLPGVSWANVLEWLTTTPPCEAPC
jgi:hypothetical protein